MLYEISLSAWCISVKNLTLSHKQNHHVTNARDNAKWLSIVQGICPWMNKQGCERFVFALMDLFHMAYYSLRDMK